MAADAPAHLSTRRPMAWQDRLRSHRVEVDGAVVATLRAGQQVRVPVDYGTHTVCARIAWTGSPTEAMVNSFGGQSWLRLRPDPTVGTATGSGAPAAGGLREATAVTGPGAPGLLSGSHGVGGIGSVAGVAASGELGDRSAAARGAAVLLLVVLRWAGTLLAVLLLAAAVASGHPWVALVCAAWAGTSVVTLLAHHRSPWRTTSARAQLAALSPAQRTTFALGAAAVVAVLMTVAVTVWVAL